MTVIIPGTSRPSNLQVAYDGAFMLDSDMFNICDRVREISPLLYIVLHDGNAKATFIIMERCQDGVDRKVFSCNELDARALKRLEYIMSIPVADRLKAFEKMEAMEQEKQRENDLEQLYENLGRPMWTQLEHDGFIDSRPVSYPKAGMVGRRS